MIKFPVRKNYSNPSPKEILYDNLKHFLDSFRLNAKNNILTLCEDPFIPLGDRKLSVESLIHDDGIELWNIDNICWEKVSYKNFAKICTWELFEDEFSEFYDKIPQSYHNEIQKMHDEHAPPKHEHQPEPDENHTESFTKQVNTISGEDIKKSLNIVEETDTIVEIEKEEPDDDEEEYNPYKNAYSKTSW